MIRFFINQHKAVNLLVLLVLGLGIFTFITGRKERFPNIGIDVITIVTVYAGASAENIEKLITKKIETEVNSVENIERITSYTSEGLSTLYIELDNDADRPSREILNDIKSAVDKLELPTLAEKPIIQKVNFDSTQINIVVKITGDVDLEVLKTVAKRFERAAERIPGVSRVEMENYAQQQIWVEILPEQLKLYNLELNTVTTAIQAQNINIPAGKVNLNGKEFFVKTSLKYQSLADIRNITLRANDSGRVILLKDIASVSWAHEELTTYKTSPSPIGNSIWLNIYKSSQGGTINVSRAINKLVATYEKSGLLPAGVSFTTANDNAIYIKQRLRVLSSNATIGLGLVFLCMILFFNMRVTFLTIIGIPFSFCLAIIIAYRLGMTLNLMTMFGLTIVIGMLIDDALIIAENIYAHAEKGLSFYDAAIVGTHEMAIPVIAIIGTTILAFLPLITLPGVFGEVISLVSKIIIITLLASLIECLFILPGHLAYLKHSTQRRSRQRAFVSYFKVWDSFFKTNRSAAPSPAPHPPLNPPEVKKKRQWFIFISNVYERLLRKIVAHPYLIVTSLLSLLAITVFAAWTQLAFVFFPGVADDINIDIKTAPSSSLAQTEAIITTTENSLRNNELINDYIVDIVSTIGQDSVAGKAVKTQSYLGFIRVVLAPARKISDDYISGVIETTVASIAGIRQHRISLRRGGPNFGDPINIYVSGENLNDLVSAANDVYTFMQTLPNTKAHYISYEDPTEEITIHPYTPRIAQFNVNPSVLANSIRYAFAETPTTTFTNLEEGSKNDIEIDLIVKYKKNPHYTRGDIEAFPIQQSQSNVIPLKNLSDISIDKINARLVKEDGTAFISVTALLKNDKSILYSANILNDIIKEEMKRWSVRYPQVDFSAKGQREHQQELTASIIRAFLIAIFSIYLVLTIIFRSYVQPLMVMSIIPLGFGGIIIGLYLTNTPIGIMPFIGGVALMGIVINNSLVMINKINQLRVRERLALTEAIVQGAKSRVRPILMTSLTTIVGFAPLAYGWVGREPFLGPMAIALMWGLIASTLLLLILLPIFYLLGEQFKAAIYKIFNKKYQYRGIVD